MIKSFFGFLPGTLMIIVPLIMLVCSRQSTIDYFGQEPPGSIPKLLAPGFISISHSSILPKEIFIG